MMLRTLKKPYPFIFNKFSYILPALVTFLLILFLAPLGFSSVDFNERVIIALVISIIIANAIYFDVKTLQKCFPDFMDEQKWTVAKELLLWFFVLCVIIIAITIVFMTIIIYQYSDEGLSLHTMILKALYKTTYITIGISIIPITVSILFEQKNHKEKQLSKATQFSKILQQQLNDFNQSVALSKNKIQFTSDTNDVELQVLEENVIYIKSDSNYIEIHFYDANIIQKKLIRNRIKVVEALLPKKYFFRCHNRYIINKNFITKIDGNARGLLLSLKNSNEIIPVSRSKIKDFENFISS